ncbi:MAG: hypothetical protein RLO52_13425 [Sandaracinaceae bacterium]|nr:MAG: hypothetical protein EVA89_38790 [Sandaracinaceae bacterium]HBQ18219.1 hypothetical protein [Myxococcales bacterium]
MRRLITIALGLSCLGLVSLAFAPRADAQVYVVEESQAEEQVVERGYVQGQGRGIQYGAHLVSPIYVTDIRRGVGGSEILGAGGGIGVQGRIGWEFPMGFTLEAIGGLAANGVDTLGMDDRSAVLLRFDVGLGARYMIFNATAFVPFIQVQAGLRFYNFEWTVGGGETDGELTLPLGGAIGAQIELTPFFGLEFGCAVDYSVTPGDWFAEGFVAVTPFAGVTLYLYDENEE